MTIESEARGCGLNNRGDSPGPETVAASCLRLSKLAKLIERAQRWRPSEERAADAFAEDYRDDARTRVWNKAREQLFIVPQDHVAGFEAARAKARQDRVARIQARPGPVPGESGVKPQARGVAPVPGCGAAPRGLPGESSGDPWKIRGQSNPPSKPLGNSERSKAFRRELFRCRETSRRLSANPRHIACGRTRVAGEVVILRQRNNPERCCFGGIATCGQVWECLVCATRIRSERARELQTAVGWHCARAGSEAQLLTLTIRHRFGDELQPLRVGVAQAWRRFTRGEPWKRFASRVGLVGHVRALEVTHGANGWHPHLHVVLLARDVAQLALERDWICDRWQACVVAELGDAAEPNASHGVDLRACAKADYLAKLGLEVASPSPKAARGGNRSPFEILASIDAPAHVADLRDASERASDRAEDVYLWQTWSADMKGARMLTWSRGLRVACGLEAEQTDEEIAAALEGHERVATVDDERWSRGVRSVPQFQARLLEAAERGGARAVEQFIAREVGPP